MQEKPTKFGRYQVKGVIGKGAMGVIYLAEDPVIGRQVAIKVIQLNAGLSDEEVEGLQTRFEREFRSAGTLSHPNIVTVHDVGNEGSMPFIAMEYIDGKTLEHLINEQRALSFDEISDLVAQICDGLDFAHQHGVVHRDIKPANILLDRAGRPKITDFGVAKLTESGMTHTGTMVGTPWYMSPEQVVGEPVTGAADQFSVAVMTYQLLTRERPFSGERSSTVLYKIVHEEPVRPHLLNPRLMDRIDDVLLRAFQKNPTDRYASCTEFADELRDALGVAAARTANRTLSGAPAPPDEWPTASMTLDAGMMKQWQTAAQSAARSGAQSAARSAPGAAPPAEGSAPPPAAPAAAAPAAARAKATAPAKGGATPKTGGGIPAAAWIAIGALVVLIGVGLALFLMRGGGGGGTAAEEEVALEDALDTGAPVDVPLVLPEELPPELAADLAAAGEGLEGSTFRVITRPEGATVSIDGVRQEAKTPADVELEGDRHTLQLELAGHRTVRWTYAADRLSADQKRTRRLYFPLAAEGAVGEPPKVAAADRSPAAAAAASAPRAPEPPTSPLGTLDTSLSTVRGGREVAMPKKIVDAAPPAVSSLPAGKQPIVILELTLDPEGRVADAKVLRGLDPALDEIARRTSYQWRYEVAPHKGKPVNTIVTSTVLFQ